MSNPVLDIRNRNQTFKKLKGNLILLMDAFRMVVHDYRHHIEDTLEEELDLNVYSREIQYRVSSAEFHFELLLLQEFKIEKDLLNLMRMQENSEGFSAPYFQETSREEIDAILDSIVFHLGATYDYLGRIINYVIDNKNRSSLKWNSLYKSCQQNRKYAEYSYLSNVVIEEHKLFVDKLFSYRSRVIHEKSERSTSQVSKSLADTDWQIVFFAPKRLIANFDFLRKKSAFGEITVNYASSWLIFATINSLSRILLALKVEMETRSKFPNHLRRNYYYTVVDQNFGKPRPFSFPVWQKLEAQVKQEFDL